MVFLFPFQLNEEDKQKRTNSSAQDTSASLELNFEKEIESVTTQVQRLAPPFYDEEDILNLDAVIDTPPRPSGIIRVKLKFKGRRKPMPIENPWEG